MKKLKKDFPNALLYASDISEKVMETVDCVEDKKIGSLTNIPYDDEKFNIVYTCEALEHAINIGGGAEGNVESAQTKRQDYNN